MRKRLSLAEAYPDLQGLEEIIASAIDAYVVVEQWHQLDNPDKLDGLSVPLRRVLEIINNDPQHEHTFYRLVKALVNARDPSLHDQTGEAIGAMAAKLSGWVLLAQDIMEVAPKIHQKRGRGAPRRWRSAARRAAFHVLADYWVQQGGSATSFSGAQPNTRTLGAFILDAMLFVAPMETTDNLVEAVRSWITDDYLGGRERRRRPPG